MSAFSDEYVLQGGTGGLSSTISSFYSSDDGNWPSPPAIRDPNTGETVNYGSARSGAKPSIFNRYTIFFFNNKQSNSTVAQNYFDENRNEGTGDEQVITRPTSSNLVRWSKSGKTNAVEFDWPDFLWCKNYGAVPNNYMLTLRRFASPVNDDLFDNSKNPAPDIARLITWIDGETNTMESAGLKFSYKMNWKELTAEIQQVEYKGAYQSEGFAFGDNSKIGSVIKSASMMTQDGYGKNALKNPAFDSYNPYEEGRNVIMGPVDIIKSMMVRDRGLEFSQDITLTFEFQVRSINGVDPKVAMIDLISNVVLCTMNKGSFWGGELRHWGGYAQKIKPLGDPSKIEGGDYGGYVKSLLNGLMGRLGSLSDGQGFSLSGLANAVKSIGSNVMGNVFGGALEGMGRPGIVALNALLTGEDTGEWHLTIGNPANPIAMVGNLVLEDTDIQFSGGLDANDFPTEMKVTCKLKPARPRDREDIISMFSRHGRTYLTEPPQSSKYAGNLVKGGLPPTPKQPNGQDASQMFNETTVRQIQDSGIARRFPNHFNDTGLVTQTARTIG